MCTAHTGMEAVPGIPGAQRKVIRGNGKSTVYLSHVANMLTKKVDKAKDSIEVNGVRDKVRKGLIVRSKIEESRFSKQVPISFYLSFTKGMNPYTGITEYLSWDVCGIDRGKWSPRVDLAYELVYKKIVDKDNIVGLEFDGAAAKKVLSNAKYKVVSDIYRAHVDEGTMELINGTAVFTEKILENFDEDGKYPKPTTNMVVLSSNINTWVARHLGERVLSTVELMTSTVFTDDVITQLDEKIIRPMFELPASAIDNLTLDQIMGDMGDDDDDMDSEMMELLARA
jgi:hypothetical protein